MSEDMRYQSIPDLVSLDQIVIVEGDFTQIRSISRNNLAGKIHSIQEYGLLTPLKVGKLETAGPYKGLHILIDGHHRFSALKQLGHAKAQVQVYELGYEQREQMRLIAITSNWEQAGLSYIERVCNLKPIIEYIGHNEKIATRGGDRKSKAHGEPLVRDKSIESYLLEFLGLDESCRKTLRKDLATFKGITPAVYKLLSGTDWGDSCKVVRAIANLPSDKDKERVAEILVMGKARNVQEAIAMATKALSIESTAIEQSEKRIQKASKTLLQLNQTEIYQLVSNNKKLASCFKQAFSDMALPITEDAKKHIAALEKKIKELEGYKLITTEASNQGILIGGQVKAFKRKGLKLVKR